MKEIPNLNADVLIIGGGATGHVAAWELARRGHEVIMLRTGAGASPGISGFNVPCAEAGDTVEKYIEDTNASGRGQGGKELTKALCEGALGLPEYLENLGFVFDRNADGSLFTRKSLGSSYGRVVGHGNSSGSTVLNILDSKLKQLDNFRVLSSARALRLISDGKTVSGAFVYDEKEKAFFNVFAKATLLCTGGFAGIFPFTSNSKDISGDGTAMALLAGCGLIDMEFVQFEPSSAVWPPQIRGKGVITTLFYEGAVMKNSLGERFMFKYDPRGECVNKDALSHAIETEIREGRGTEHGGVWFDASGVDTQRLHDAYEPFIRRYASVGIDFTKEPVELANAAHTTIGGAQIDATCRSGLKGLYVAGEAAGHVHGSNRIGGSAGSETLVFGQIAAASIKEDIDGLTLKKEAFVPASGSGSSINPERLEEIRAEEKALIGEAAGVFRDGETLERCAARMKELYEELFACGECEDPDLKCRLIRTQNDVITAMALFAAADARCDSCGSHQRTDYPDAPAENYHTLVRTDNHNIKTEKIINS
ncbi:MAG: FAD-binding protein [Lachnospiraceae bacterium]|nr:FAD-binding protein [Lachnospiraceae bacterium]